MSPNQPKPLQDRTIIGSLLNMYDSQMDSHYAINVGCVVRSVPLDEFL